MESTDLYLEHDKVYLIDQDSDDAKQVDYDGIKVDTIYFVITKTKRYSIYKKSENFDDEFLKIEEDIAGVKKFVSTIPS